MKKFFSKYFPVEGEIKSGDWYINDEGEIHLWQNAAPLYHLLRCKLAKLFLCSRDTQVGDLVNGEVDAYNLGTVSKFDDNPHIVWVKTTDGLEDWVKSSLYKVIGEISPDADVIEGQEFTEDEIKNLTII